MSSQFPALVPAGVTIELFLGYLLSKADARALKTTLLALLAWPCVGAALDVRDFGAKGDGTTKDTKAIQSAIDKAAAAGGTVVISPGRYVSGTIHLRSNLTLRIEQGATLMFSPDDGDFDPYEELPYHIDAPPKKVEPQVSFVTRTLPERRRLSAPPAWDDTETSYFHYALLSGDGVHNVAIEGRARLTATGPGAAARNRLPSRTPSGFPSAGSRFAMHPITTSVLPGPITSRLRA